MESKMIKIKMREKFFPSSTYENQILLKVYNDEITKRKYDAYGEYIDYKEPVLIFAAYKPSKIFINKFLPNNKKLIKYKERLSDIIYLSRIEWKDVESNNDNIIKFINEEKEKLKKILKALN